MFRFKQFSVEHRRSSVKVGTDGVLIGAWCDVSGVTTALDVGTGCGLIALMLAQRSSVAVIDAVDIDHDSIEESKENFKSSPWGDRLHCHECDFTKFDCGKKYDLIVSNPPFFVNGILAPNQSRRNARHTVTLTYEKLLSHAAELLEDDGKIAIISPVDVREEILDVCQDNKLFVSSITEVISVARKEPVRLLWQISKKMCETVISELVIETSPGVYSEAYKALCQGFYLRF